MACWRLLSHTIRCDNDDRATGYEQHHKSSSPLDDGVVSPSPDEVALASTQVDRTINVPGMNTDTMGTPTGEPSLSLWDQGGSSNPVGRGRGGSFSTHEPEWYYYEHVATVAGSEQGYWAWATCDFDRPLCTSQT